MRPLVLVTADRDLLAVLADTYLGDIHHCFDVQNAVEYVASLLGRAVLAFGPDINATYLGVELPLTHILLHTDRAFLNQVGVLYRTAFKCLELPAELDWLTDFAGAFPDDRFADLDRLLDGEAA